MSENCDSCSLNMKALAPPGTMWPYEVPITTVDETERTVTYMLKDGLASHDVYVTSTSTTKESWKYLSLV